MRDRREFLEILFFTVSTTFFTRTDFLLHGVVLSAVAPVALKRFTTLNPRPAGGGAFERPLPLRFFEDSENTAARSAAGFSPTLPPIFSATFVKISTQSHVRSGHQVRSSDPTTK